MATLLRPAELQEAPDQIEAFVRPDLDALNELLRNEIIASDAYRRILEVVPQDDNVAEWIRIRLEHQRAVSMLAIRIRLSGGTPHDPRRAWRVSAITMYSTRPKSVMANLLRELITLEEQLLRHYEDHVDSPDLCHECQEMIRNDFVPTCQAHIAALDRMHDAVAA